VEFRGILLVLTTYFGGFMPKLETKPTMPGETTKRDPSTWIAIEGMIVCGYSSADCYVCAQRVRDQDYPGRKIAVIVEYQYFPICMQDFSDLSREQKIQLLQEERLEWMFPRLFSPL